MQQAWRTPSSSAMLLGVRLANQGWATGAASFDVRPCALVVPCVRSAPPQHLTAQAGVCCLAGICRRHSSRDHCPKICSLSSPSRSLKREIVERQRRSHLPITPCADGFGGGKRRRMCGSMWDHHRCIPPAGQRYWSSDGQREQGACACPGVQRTCYDVNPLPHLGTPGS